MGEVNNKLSLTLYVLVKTAIASNNNFYHIKDMTFNSHVMYIIT